MIYSGRIPYGTNQVQSSSLAITVENTDVAVFTTGSLLVSGSLTSLGGFTGSFSGSLTGSANFTTLTSSNALITGNVTVLGTASINTLVVNQTQYTSGSNQLGDGPEDTQTFFGTVRIPTGSFTVTGSSFMTGSLIVTGGITGSFSGSGIISSASFATNALTASFVNPLVQTVLITGSLSVSGSTVISGSLQVTQGITGSLFGTSSLSINALTASFVNPLTQSVFISGSLIVTGSTIISSSAATQLQVGSNLLFISSSGNVGIGTSTPNFRLDVSGSSEFVGNVQITGSTFISASAGTGSALTVYKSGSTVVSIQGSQGELFSITDSLSGSLFSVSNISGLPILEVFSDNTTLIGNYLDPMLVTTQLVTATSGSTTIYSLPTASYDGAFYDYVVRSGSNSRAGQIMAIWSGSSVNYTDNSTTDFGSTANLSFNVIVSGSNMVLRSTVTTGSWTVKTIIRSI
jgi:hypothetical protein